jgi:hypothetical protein
MASVPEVALYSGPETERAKEKRQEGFPERESERRACKSVQRRGRVSVPLLCNQHHTHTEKRGCDFALFGAATHTPKIQIALPLNSIYSDRIISLLFVILFAYAPLRFQQSGRLSALLLLIKAQCKLWQKIYYENVQRGTYI